MWCVALSGYATRMWRRLHLGGELEPHHARHAGTDAVRAMAGASTERARVDDNAGLAMRERNPPRTSLPHCEYDDLPDAKRIVMPLEEMVCGTFLFAPQEISVLRDQLFPPLRKHGHEVRYHI
jgi:hypothetical protein